MHTTVVRVQNVFGFFTSVAFAIAALIAVSVVFAPQSPSASMELRNIQVVKGRPHYYSTKREEYANIRFDLDTDLSTLFNWNTKQVFLYIKAIYPSHLPSEPPTEAILWDAIIPATSAPWHHNTYIHPSTKAPKKVAKSKPQPPPSYRATAPGDAPGVLHLRNQKPKYQISDPTGKIAERGNATLELGWNIQPWVGALVWANYVDLGRWSGVKGGRSETFEFPELKGAVKKEELGTMKGGEGNRGKPA
ncbi:signal peptidase 22 kDa subunit [Aulographum hederae CBS 113979]|uniref:Signal peptidase subunit 3 n=1 Tax=Aulographum hederae CBS 113979 TaxID=1176131 RepID=A0A6G1GKA2_9PEZI|nr:signal peptidase 22 kDa subunit [Aulographum hederae CBS 113979]